MELANGFRTLASAGSVILMGSLFKLLSGTPELSHYGVKKKVGL